MKKWHVNQANKDGKVKKGGRTRKSGTSSKNQQFWNKEYKDAPHLTLSINPSEDLQKFTRYLEREYGRHYLNPIVSVIDLGCGNGRNLIFLSNTFGMRGVGYDISREAISQAKKNSEGLPLSYEVRSITEPLQVPNSSQTLVLDMMTSHFLINSEEVKQRDLLQDEILRVLKPDGWLFFKTFLLDEDLNAKRLLKDNPAEEAGSYIHPEIGVAEHVFTEKEIVEFLSPHFIIHKILKSHRHLQNGKAHKRRSISVYAQKR